MAKYQNIPVADGDPRYFECLSWERQQVEFRGVWIYREFQEREGNPEYSFYTADGFWASETLDGIREQIEASNAYKRDRQNRETEERLVYAKQESKELANFQWRHAACSLAGGALGFTIAGPIGFIVGAFIGGASIIL